MPKIKCFKCSNFFVVEVHNTKQLRTRMSTLTTERCHGSGERGSLRNPMSVLIGNLDMHVFKILFFHHYFLHFILSLILLP